jgi:hypothetical protein
MRLVYIILGIAFFLAGMAGLGITMARWNEDYQSLIPYKLGYNRHTNELLARFKNQSSMTTDEQTELMKDGARYAAELRAEQKLRLRADLDQLAAGDKHPNDSVADLIYGENWQSQVEEYRRSKERSELAITASLLSMLVGIGITLMSTYRWLIDIIKRRKALSEELKRRLADRIMGRSKPAVRDSGPKPQSDVLEMDDETPQAGNNEELEEKSELKMILAGQAGIDESKHFDEEEQSE